MVLLFNLELSYTSEFFKKLKLHSPKQLMQFQLFEKFTVPINSKLNSKPYDYQYKHNMTVKVATVSLPNGPLGWCLSQFTKHEVTRSISTPQWMGY